MGRIGMTEIVICLVLFVLLFGAKKFADLGKGLGEGIRNFKKGIRDDEAPKQLPSKEDEPSEDKRPA